MRHTEPHAAHCAVLFNAHDDGVGEDEVGGCGVRWSRATLNLCLLMQNLQRRSRDSKITHRKLPAQLSSQRCVV